MQQWKIYSLYDCAFHKFGGHFYFMENKRYVYILTNPCFKENWVKIGKTDNLDRRITELSQATGIPLPFKIYAVLETSKYNQAEHMIHKLIGKLAPDLRINPKRKFFNIEPEDAVSIMQEISNLIDDAKLLYYNNSHNKPQQGVFGSSSRIIHAVRT